MKKIELITYHNPYNYGATLQALASVIFFENMGFKVEIINYIPSSKRNFASIKNTINSIDGNIIKKIIVGAIKNISYRKMKKKFDLYCNNLFPLSREYISIDELIKNPPNADIYCTGSDQVWNNYYTKSFEKAFFLDFVPKGSKCFSYSASFGKKEFNEKEMGELRNELKKYEFITVRELDGINILNNLGIDNAKQILDPTLMLDFNNWDKFTKCKLTNTKYILVYQLHGDSDTYNIAKKYAKLKNLKIIKINTMYHHYKKGAKNIMLPTIEEFLGYIKNAEFVFTDSFHGVAFSLIFNRKLGITLPHNFSNRITSLLEQIEGNEFIIDDYDRWVDNVDCIPYKMIQKNLIDLQKNKINIIEDYLNKKR